MMNRYLVLLTLLAAIASCQAEDAVCGPGRVPALSRGMPGAPTVEVLGTITAVHGTQMTITTRDGKPVDVDVKALAGSVRTTAASIGLPVEVLGTRGLHGVLVAQVINRVGPRPDGWPPDCYEPEAGPKTKVAP